jgi:hypothetical protein
MIHPDHDFFKMIHRKNAQNEKHHRHEERIVLSSRCRDAVVGQKRDSKDQTRATGCDDPEIYSLFNEVLYEKKNKLLWRFYIGLFFR